MKRWIFCLVVTGLLQYSAKGETIHGGGPKKTVGDDDSSIPKFGGPGSGPGSATTECDNMKCQTAFNTSLKKVHDNAVICAKNPKMECCPGDVGDYSNCKLEFGKNRTNKGALNNEGNNRRKRSLSFGQYALNLHLSSRVKRSGAKPPEYWWRCDNANRKCCRTCRRTLPFIEPFKTEDGQDVYPIYCPTAGGYQLIEQVECRQQYCRSECLWDWTFYSVMVTTKEPHHISGHCDLPHVPTFFTRIKVWSHCTCPEIFQYKPRPPTPGPTPRPTTTTTTTTTRRTTTRRRKPKKKGGKKGKRRRNKGRKRKPKYE